MAESKICSQYREIIDVLDQLIAQGTEVEKHCALRDMIDTNWNKRCKGKDAGGGVKTLPDRPKACPVKKPDKAPAPPRGYSESDLKELAPTGLMLALSDLLMDIVQEQQERIDELESLKDRP